MKQGWEYKRLREIGHIVTGSTPSTKDETNYSPREYCFVKPSDLPSQGIALIEETEYYVSSKGLSKSRVLPTGSVLVSCIGSIGKIGILTKEACSNQQINAIIPKNDIDSKFIAYSIYAYRFLLESIANAPVVPIINKTDFSKIQIPLPPKFTQLSIVSELDKINELIRLKQEQLKDYDNLAQSIFYEMFGDPVENEKGWEVKELGQLCEVTSSKRVFINEVVDAGVPFIRGTELTALNKLVPGEKMHYTLFITQEHYERLKAITGVPKVGDLLIPSINADGIVWMVDTEEPLYFKDGRVLWIHVNHNHFNSIAIQKLMNILIKNIYASMGGATFAELKLFVLRNMKVPIPPLSVQDAFAEKIKRIDIQKLQVKKSITDLETLLASRMQYWFE